MDGWKCEQCGGENDRYVYQCRSCKAPRPLPGAASPSIKPLIRTTSAWMLPAPRAWMEEAERLATNAMLDESREVFWSGCSVDNIALDSERYGGVCVSDAGSELLLLRSDGPDSMAFRVLDSVDVLSCALVGGGSITQGVTTTQTTTATKNRVSIGGALVGGLLLGPAGGITGGLGYGRSRSYGESVGSIDTVSKNVEGTTVRITINDPKDPHFAIELAQSSWAVELCNKVAVVIKRGEKRARELEATGAIDPLTVPDAIMKLVNLNEQGYLTREEFEQQKALLLKRSQSDTSGTAKTTSWLAHPWENPSVGKLPRFANRLPGF